MASTSTSSAGRGRRRDYSRYDYSRWDGVSADLAPDGSVLRLKTDNAFATEVAQLAIVRETLRRGKLFLGNGTGAVRSINSLPIARFVEGGNGYGCWAGAHLTGVPLILGNFGDQSTRQGVFQAVKDCLSNGCVYSPTAVNLLLDGQDNFVCKLYPLTIRRLAAQLIVGEERLITARSGTFDWPGRPGAVRLYQYERDGRRCPGDSVVSPDASGKLSLVVPPEGLVIAEAVLPP